MRECKAGGGFENFSERPGAHLYLAISALTLRAPVSAVWAIVTPFQGLESCPQQEWASRGKWATRSCHCYIDRRNLMRIRFNPDLTER